MVKKLPGKLKLFSTLKNMKLWILSPVVAKIQHGICKWIWCWQTSEATPQQGTCWIHDFLDPPENEISAKGRFYIFVWNKVVTLEKGIHKLLLFLCTLTTMKNVRNVTTSTVLCHLTSKKLNQRKGKIGVNGKQKRTRWQNLPDNFRSPHFCRIFDSS